MKVSELIAELQKYPQNTEISFTNDDTLDELTIEGIYYTPENEPEMVSDFVDIKLKGEEDSEKMTEVVINVCFGGFGLSEEGVREYLKRKGKTLFVKKDGCFNHYYTSPDMTRESYFSEYDIKRDDPDLVAVVKELGERANDRCSKLSIITVPANVQWTIEEYDGSETVEEVHRSFY